MKRFIIPSLLGLVALVGLVAAYPLANASTGAERSDCPGKVVCPLTGEEVCKDRCPLAAKAEKTDTTRADCPGQVECPLTGELVCRDECPVTGAVKPAESKALALEEEAELPPCCRNKK
ncbi:MAG: hypothetical protein M3Y45_06120 [Actinomycetota bacterium]|nr:hypothetical protein [Actinomycetota bacterium]